MSIKKNIFYNVSLSALNVLFPIVTAPYISRVLGVENIGVVNFVTTCVNYFVLFAALGISSYGLREIAQCKDDQEKCSQLFSSLFAITLCSTLVVTLLFLLSVNLIPAFKEHRLLFSLYGITLYLVPITMDWYFQAKENFRMITLRSFVVKLLAFASLFIFVRERSDVIPYILISMFSIVVTQIWNLSYACKTGLRINLFCIKSRRHIKPMFVFLGIGVASGIYTMINVVMLGLLSSYEQVGYYTSSNLIAVAVVGFFGAINTVLLPRLSHNHGQNNNDANVVLLQKAFDLNALLIIPMAVGLCLIASRFVPLFYGNEFIGSIIPMQILSFKMIAIAFCIFFASNMLVVLGHEKKNLLIIVCAALISFPCNLLLISRYGAIGATITSTIVECFNLGLVLYFVYKLTKMRVRWIAMGTSTIFTLPFFALYYLCNKFMLHDIVFLCTFISISVVIYFSLQLMAKNYLVCQIVNAGKK